MGYILTMKNRMDVKLTIDIDNDDIDFVLKQVNKDYMNDYNVIKIKRKPALCLNECIAALERK